MRGKISKFHLIAILSIFTIILALIICLIVKIKISPNFSIEKNKIDIDELYIYGTHLNIKGTIVNKQKIKKMELILFDKKENTYELGFKQTNNIVNFYLGDKKNNGLLLDDLKIGNYKLFIKVTSVDSTKYYQVKNNTKYKKTEYYTIRENDKYNYILISEKSGVLNLNVKNHNQDDIYDIVIDAGHGGIDVGACYKGTCETDFTLELSQKLQKKLEQSGLKVKLTRTDIKANERFETYGKNGRIDNAMNSKAKYLFSFHLNSGLASKSGTEIYTANNIDYTLSKSIINSIVTNTNINYSNNPIFKIYDSIYTRTFQNYEIESTKEEAKEKGYDSYDITNDTVYYYIIRETGGIINGAFIDGRSGDTNSYYNTNVGIESYILELGYITNPNDSTDIKNNMDKYINAIAKAIVDNI